MKQTALLLLTALAVFPVAAADEPYGEPPEFYFTRMIYSGGGRGGGFDGFFNLRGGLLDFTCADGDVSGGNRLGVSWATDYPAADCKFMWGVERLSGITVDPDPNVVEILDDNLFKYPYLYAVEVGNMRLDNEEAARLREYLM